MIDALRLKRIIKDKGFTAAEIAMALGMSESTFRRKLRLGTLGVLDAEKLVELLKIENPGVIFFV